METKVKQIVCDGRDCENVTYLPEKMDYHEEIVELLNRGWNPIEIKKSIIHFCPKCNVGASNYTLHHMLPIQYYDNMGAKFVRRKK